MSTADEERRVFVAGLRELADLIEGSPWLPVPFTSTLQATVGRGLDQAGRFAALRRVAELLGADVVEYRASGSRQAARALPGSIEYFVHVFSDAPIKSKGRPDRVVPACEDERLPVGPAVNA